MYSTFKSYLRKDQDSLTDLIIEEGGYEEEKEEIGEEKKKEVEERSKEKKDGDIKETVDVDKKINWRKWLILASSFYMAVFQMGITPTFGMLFDDRLASSNVSSSTIGWLLSVHGVSGSIGSIFTPALVSAFSYRSVALTGSLITSATFTALAFVSSVPLLFLLFGIFLPLGSGMASTVCFIILPKCFIKRRGLAMGILTAGISAGGMVLPPLLQNLEQKFDLTIAMLVGGGFLIICCVGACTFKIPQKNNLPDVITGETGVNCNTIKQLENLKDSSDINQVEAANNSKMEKSDEAKVSMINGIKIFCFQLLESLIAVKEPRVILSSLSLTITIVSFTNVMTLIPFAVLEFGLLAEIAAWCISCSAFSNTGSRLIISAVADKKGFNRKIVYLLGATVAAASLSVFPHVSHSPYLLLSLMLVYGVGMGIFVSLHFITLPDFVGAELFASTLTVNSVVLIGTYLTLSPLIGLIKDYELSYQWSFYACAALQLSPVVLQLFVSKRDQLYTNSEKI